MLINPLLPYKSVSNVSSHSEYISCIISWRNSLKLLHSNKKCLVVSFLPHMPNGLSMLFFQIDIVMSFSKEFNVHNGDNVLGYAKISNMCAGA